MPKIDDLINRPVRYEVTAVNSISLFDINREEIMNMYLERNVTKRDEQIAAAIVKAINEAK